MDSAIRLRSEENERRILSPKACLAAESRGRLRPEPKSAPVFSVTGTGSFIAVPFGGSSTRPRCFWRPAVITTAPA